MTVISPGSSGSEPLKLLQRREVCARLRVSPATLYRLQRRLSDFPQPFLVGLQKYCWREVDINEWLASRMAATRCARASKGE
jgi:predicted DNA-binding transcriptional regulator AlpA